MVHHYAAVELAGDTLVVLTLSHIGEWQRTMKQTHLYAAAYVSTIDEEDTRCRPTWQMIMRNKVGMSTCYSGGCGVLLVIVDVRCSWN